MSSTIYQDSFVNARPNAPYHAVTARLSLTRALTQDLASYYHERALLEDAYVKSLQKLSARLHQAGSHTVFAGIDELGLDERERQRQLGAWHAVRVRLETEVNELAKHHETWREKTVEEVETPLRQSLSKPGWARWQQGEASIGSAVREYESTLDKVQKVSLSQRTIVASSKQGTKSSGSTSTKLLTSQAQLATLGSSLKSAMPAFLETSQKLDESHQLFLKEALIRSGTFTSDLGRDRMEAGEDLLNTVLGIDEQAEIQGWGLREGMKASGGGSAAASGVPNTSEFGATSITSASGYGGAVREEAIAEEPVQAQPPVQRAPTQDRTRAPSNARTTPPPAAPLPLPSPAAPKKSGGGFKFSKVFKRDKGSSGAASSKYGMIEANNPYRGSVDRQSIEFRDSASTVGRPEAATRSSLLGLQAPRLDRTTSGSSSLMGGSLSAGAMQAPIMPTTSTKNRDSLMPGGAGGLFRRASSAGMASGGQNGGQIASGSAIPEAREKTAASNNGATIDEEGYSVPPAGYDKQPWERTAQGSNLMDDDDEDESVDTAAPLQSSSRAPAVALAPTIITEAESDRQAALEKVQSTLLSAGPASNLSRRTTRGRRDNNRLSSIPGLAGSNSSTIPDDIPLAQVIERQQRSREASLDSSSNSPAATTTVFTPSALNRVVSPTMSSSDRAMSMMSTTSRFGGGAADPFEHASSPGLRANIVETVNVLSKGGEVNRVMITGEVHLSHRSDSSATAASPLRFRIAQFDQFEKAAPNTKYISPVTGGSPGEFEVLPSLAAQHGSTVVVLKYQVRIGEGQEGRYNPLSVKALWKCEPTQTKLIITYKPNALPSGSPSPFGEDEGDHAEPLQDLEFSIPISANVSTVQAKPALAKWHADTHCLVFTIAEPLEQGARTEQKLLASLGTDQQSLAQPLAIKWTIKGRTLSEVGVISDGNGFKEVRKSVVAGKYLVAP
ncbi:BQ2448_7030 [Microbotryum intermedium]|uniref:BQ2448_7030 protein n=1 Tax=Microbotryum intermedium TaxID=269621 RepID=A0A238FIX4_9BASI|nr:BQ2448_7030 [Microbotryum intermedium]